MRFSNDFWVICHEIVLYLGVVLCLWECLWAEGRALWQNYCTVRQLSKSISWMTRLLSPKSQGWMSLLFWHISCVCVPRPWAYSSGCSLGLLKIRLLGEAFTGWFNFKPQNSFPGERPRWFIYSYCEMLHTYFVFRCEGRTIRVLYVLLSLDVSSVKSCWKMYAT